MTTGRSLSYIYLLDKRGDTLKNVFLDLQPELWDTTHITLTVWLDPGRIKRGLVLNKQLGNPLKTAETYRLVVMYGWKDSHGFKLPKKFTKEFVAGPRDEQIPDINKWQLTLPKAGTNDPLIINTHEPLDHYLLPESIFLLGGDGKMIYTQTGLSNNDRTIKVTPIANWQKQHYQLIVKGSLEDLAGNNLNRVFDRDITKEKVKDDQFYKRGFDVK
jgi:hypothetical protein